MTFQIARQFQIAGLAERHDWKRPPAAEHAHEQSELKNDVVTRRIAHLILAQRHVVGIKNQNREIE